MIRTCFIPWNSLGELARSMLGMPWPGDEQLPPDDALICDRLEITGQHQDQGGHFAVINVRWSGRPQ